MKTPVRVVAGEAKGRKLVAPEGRETRPTSDRVRESIFNALLSIGALRGAKVLDLFAGSGALGIEALSRGARQCVFIDNRAQALTAIRKNLASTGFDRRGVVVGDDALRYLRAEPTRFDLVLADPPYAFREWPELLAAVDAAVLVTESDREVPGDDRWRESRVKRYGGTVVTFLVQADGED